MSSSRVFEWSSVFSTSKTKSSPNSDRVTSSSFKLYFILQLFFHGTEDWTQGLLYARQMLYHWALSLASTSLLMWSVLWSYTLLHKAKVEWREWLPLFLILRGNLEGKMLGAGIFVDILHHCESPHVPSWLTLWCLLGFLFGHHLSLFSVVTSK